MKLLTNESVTQLKSYKLEKNCLAVEHLLGWAFGQVAWFVTRNGYMVT